MKRWMYLSALSLAMSLATVGWIGVVLAIVGALHGESLTISFGMATLFSTASGYILKYGRKYIK